MKKFFIALGCAAAMLPMVSCGGSSSNGNTFADSLSVAFGEFRGTDLAQNYNMLPDDQKKAMPKEDVLRGLKQVMMADTTQSGYVSGLSIGLQLYGQLYNYEQNGVEIDRQKLYEAFAKAFMADSVNEDAFVALRSAYQSLSEQAQQHMMAHQREVQEAAMKAKAEGPEAKKNVAEGEDFINKAKAEDASIVTTESGLSYKVLEEGNGPVVGKGGSATLKYVGKLVDGTVFDSNDQGVRFTTNAVIPGFGEGLALLKKGAKYVFYIPGELAYGVNGAGDKIGPNAFLIFEVEALDVEPAE